MSISVFLWAEEAHNRVAKYPKELKAPHVKNTTIQVVVKAACFQTEFRIITGRCNFSCRPIHSGNTTINTRATESNTIFWTSLMLAALPVITLFDISFQDSSKLPYFGEELTLSHNSATRSRLSQSQHQSNQSRSSPLTISSSLQPLPFHP